MLFYTEHVLGKPARGIFDLVTLVNVNCSCLYVNHFITDDMYWLLK